MDSQRASPLSSRYSGMYEDMFAKEARRARASANIRVDIATSECRRASYAQRRATRSAPGVAVLLGCLHNEGAAAGIAYGAAPRPRVKARHKARQQIIRQAL